MRDRLKKAIRRRAEQGTIVNKNHIRCSDLHSIELGIPLPPLKLLELQGKSQPCQQCNRTTLGDSDTPVASLYRLYKHVVLRHIGFIEDEIDYFWSRRWEVASIPDPFDKDPERCAVLACCTFLLAEYFNGRVELDLQDEEQGNRDRLEKAPRWALETEPLPHKLFIGNALDREDTESTPASRLFMIKNVYIDLMDLGLG